MPNSHYEELKQLIHAGRIDEALAELRRHAEGYPAGFDPFLSLLQARWTNLQQQEISGTIAREEAELQRNRMNASLLRLIDLMATKNPSIQKTIKEMQDELSKTPSPETLQNKTRISGSPIQIQGSGDVIVGSGNTISKKIFHALGRWQFAVILLGIGALAALGFLFGDKILDQQTASFASLSSIQAELAKLAGQNTEVASWSAEARQEFDAGLQEGMKALKNGGYETAVRHLEEVARKAPLATVYKNLSYAYEQMGDWERASDNRSRALEVDPKAYAEKPYAELQGRRINLLLPENGGKVYATEYPVLAEVADGLLRGQGTSGWVVYGFKEGRTAAIDQVDFYVPSASTLENGFEILVGNESPTGNFTSIGKFKPFNGLLTDTPFQPFPFDLVRAKYVKIQMPGNFIWYEVRLWGRLE